MAKKNAVRTAVVVKSLEKKANPIIKKLTDMVIKTEADYQLAAKLLSELKQLKKGGKHEKQLFTIPLNQLLKTTHEHFKPFFDLVDATEKEVKSGMTTFLTAQESKKLKVAQDLETGAIKKVSTYVARTEALTVHSGYAKARTIQKLHCVNEKLTPREFLVPDETKIREALKEGKTVKGWELREEKSIAV